MSKNISQMVVDFNIYDKNEKMIGVSKVTMPTLQWVSQQMQGAGIAGIVEVIARGMMDAMTLGLDLRMCGEEAYKLTTPEVHTITLRNAEQYEDPVLGQIKVEGIKHVFGVMPKSLNPGSVAQASTHDGSSQFAVRRWACYFNGIRVLEIDQLNGICYMYGVDYRADINAVI